MSISDSYLDDIDKMKKENNFEQLEHVYHNLHEEIYEKLQGENPEVVMMGISRFQFYLLPSLKYESKIYLYSLCGGIPYVNGNAPPITSDYLPQHNFFMRIHNYKQWYKRWKRKGSNKQIRNERRYYPWNDMKSICKVKGIKWRFGIDGYYPDFPVLIFGSRFFEISQKNLYHLGLGIDDGKIKNVIDYKGDSEKLIYCSFGTMNERYEKLQEFMIELVEVFRIKTKWKLILSIGEKRELALFLLLK